MFREIEAECYLMVDGDDTYEASDATSPRTSGSSTISETPWCASR